MPLGLSFIAFFLIHCNKGFSNLLCTRNSTLWHSFLRKANPLLAHPMFKKTLVTSPKVYAQTVENEAARQVPNS